MAKRSATKNTLKILLTSREILKAVQTTSNVINLASSDFFLMISMELVVPILSSILSMLDVPRRVDKETSTIIVKLHN